MRNQRGKMSGQRLSKVIVSLTLALMLLCGNFSTTAPAIFNALALEVVAETPAAPVEQPQEPAPQQEAEAPVEQPSDPVPQGEIVPEGKPEGEAKPATPTTDEPTKTDAPETPAAGTPAADAPAAGNPATEPSETDTSETPATDTPATDEPTKTDTPATDTPATDTPATDTPATDTPATDVPATDVPMVDERSPLQRAIEDESGAYVDVQNGKVYENQNLNKLMGVLDGGLAFATEYTVREDGEDSVRVIFRTEDDSLLIGYIPASRATELGRQQTIDKLTGKGVTFLFNKEPDLPLSVIGFTYAQPETEQGDSENPPAEEETPAIVVEEIEPYVAAAIRNSVNLRKEPSTSGPLMAQLDKGVRMTVRGKLTNAEGELWYYVTYHQNPYYVMAELVEAVDASTEQPAETDTETPDETEQPADEVFDFVFMAYPGELPVMITANGDDYYTHTAADGTLTLLAYGSFKGAQPAFYYVDENEIVHTDAPFGADAPELDLTVEPDEEEAIDPFVQMEYAGDPITGITANGDGYYTYTASDDAVTLLVYGSANSGEPAFYAVDEELVINLTAPFVPEATPTAAPETDDELVFMPLMPDSSAVPEYYQLVSAPSTTEEAEPVASAFLNWLIPRACAEEEVPDAAGGSDTPDETAGEPQPSAPAQQSTPKYIYSFTVDNKGISETYYRIYGSLKRKNGEVIAVGFFACDKDGSFDTSNYILIDPKDDFAQMNAEDKEAALITMLKTLPTLAEVEALVASDAAGTAATLASTEATLESIRQQMDALQLNMSSDEQAAFTARLTDETPEGMQNYTALTAYFAQRHAQQLANVQAAIDALPTVEAVQAMDVTAEDYAQRFAAVETATAAAQTLLTSYKATLTEEALANLEALLGTPEVAESNGEAPANGETPADGAPAEGELLTEAASQPTRLVKLNDLTAYFADKRFEAMVRELQAAVATLPTAEATAAMIRDSDEYLAAKTQYNAAWTTLQSLYAQMTEADKTRFAADERVLAALQAMTDLFTYFENKEIPYMQAVIDGMPDPYWTGFLAELLYSETDNSASMYDLPTGETPAGETPAEAPAGEAPAGETAGETPATDAIGPAAAEAEFLANLQEVYDGLGLALDPADPRAAGDELFAELWESLGDVQPRAMFLTHDALDTEAGQAYLDEKLGAQENAETTRLEKYNTLLGIMQGISGIQTLAETADQLTADWVYVSKLEVTKIVDGVAPFDTNPSSTAVDYSGRPGNDANDSNKLVRTFDDITYNMTITTALHDNAAVSAVINGYLYYEFTIPGYSAKEATFNTTAMSWIGTPVTDLANVTAGQSGYILTEGTSSVTIRGKYYCTPSGASANAFPGQVLPYATVRVNAAKNGDEIQPTFKWWADYGTETGNCPTHYIQEWQSVTADKVKVTAQMRLNVQIKAANMTYTQKGTFDFFTGDDASKKDGTAWSSDTEMKNTGMEDLTYSATRPAGKEVVGVLIEIRPTGLASEVKVYAQGSRPAFNVELKIPTDLSVVGNVYICTAETKAWTMSNYSDAAGVPSLLGNNPDAPTVLPTASYIVNTPSRYVKAVYDDSGYKGGDTSGFLVGDSLYIVPWQATITKGIAQQENSADKKIYITSSGERVVDFKMQPKLSSGMTIPASGITPGDRGRTTVTITDTLPAKITYIPGSTFFGGTNDYVQNAEPGRQGTVRGGVNTEPTAVKNGDGTTTLTWLLENVPVDVIMPTIYYSCDIGQEGSANDVVDNEQFTNTVQIRAEGDKRDVNVANGNLATAGFSISTVGAAAISKIPISRYNEPGEAFGWTMNAGNNGGSVISNAMVLDTMPENGYQGSSFTTPLKVVSWKINTRKLTNFATWHAFYTVSTGANRTKVNQYTVTDILNAPHQSTVDGNTITWVEVGISADGSVNVPGNVSPTALILIGDLGIGAACETTLMVDALTGSTKANEIYVNQLSNGDTTTTSRSYIIGRTLDGVAWLDANYNGQRNSDEAQLAGVTVTLYKLKDGKDPALESSYEPVLVNGNPATVTTGATNNAMNLADGSLTTYAPDAGDTGRYKFIGLNAGTYAVKFSGTTIAPYRASPVDTGADTLDSDGKPTYTGATLTSTFIPNIVMPTKENMATFQYDDHYHDSGFDVYRIEFTVGKTVAGNAADRTKTFEFTLTFANKADFAGQSFAYVGGSTVTGVAAPDNGTLTLDADGKATIRLKHGQTITVKGVPVGTTNTIQVTETSPVSEGYAASYTYTVGTTAKATNVQSNETTALKTSDSAPSAGNAEAQKVAFTNTRTITVPTGILLDIWPYLLIVAVAMGGVAWLLVAKRKNNHKKQNSDDWN